MSLRIGLVLILSLEGNIHVEQKVSGLQKCAAGSRNQQYSAPIVLYLKICGLNVLNRKTNKVCSRLKMRLFW